MIKIEKRAREPTLPVVLEATGESSRSSTDAVVAWLTGARAELLEILDRVGVFLLRGFSCLESPSDYERIAKVLCTELVDYVGGTSPRRVVSSKIVTSTEIPAPFSIPLHQEMSYTTNSPDKVFFFGSIPAAAGGATLLADMRRVTARLEPLRARYEMGRLRLRRALPPAGREGKKPGVQKAWNEVFETSDKQVVTSIAASRGWEIRWLDGDFLQLSQELVPCYRRHARTSDVVWFNQMHIFPPVALIDWAGRDGRMDDLARLQRAQETEPELMDQIVREDGSIVPDEDVRLVNRVLLDEAIRVGWQRSDVLVLDNVLVAHGREPFQGERELFAALGRDA